MKKLIITLLLINLLVACQKDDTTGSGVDPSCGTYKSGQSLRKGPEGGCYYINSNGNKTYVEREACKC